MGRALKLNRIATTSGGAEFAVDPEAQFSPDDRFATLQVVEIDADRTPAAVLPYSCQGESGV